MSETDRDSDTLTKEQQDQAKRWIQSKWKGPMVCPVSGHSEWELGPHVVQPMTHAPIGNVRIGQGPGYPSVVLVCKGCAYTMYFNAVLMGLMPAATEASNV